MVRPPPSLSVALCGLLVSACGEDPRVARRATALDVAGRWQEARDDGRDGASVEIAHETDLNDIVVTVAERVVEDAEGAALSRVRDETRRAELTATLVLGRGRDAVREEADGGENVSFDLGETTSVQVVSALVPVTPSDPSVREAALGWALRLRGDPSRLEGVLEAFVREVQPRAGDVNGTVLVTTVVAGGPLVLLPVVP